MTEPEGGARPKQKGRIVPSRYMQYERRAAGKSASDCSLSFGKRPESTASSKKPPDDFQRHKNATEMTPGVLQSTMLDCHRRARPDFELSAISDVKSSLHKIPVSKNSAKGPREKKQTVATPSSDDLIDMLDSQALLLTYASIKIEKNLSRLEEKSEMNLLTLSKEVGRLQREAHKKKLQLKHLEKEQELTEAVDRQLEALSPVSKQCARFKDQYRSFATALDSTRHDLPVKDIYVGQNEKQYLEDLREELVLTQKVLSKTLLGHTVENSQAQSVVKELEEASLKVDAELPRTFAQVMDLSAEVSKEASLHFQKACEDTVGLDAMKQFYFE